MPTGCMAGLWLTPTCLPCICPRNFVSESLMYVAEKNFVLFVRCTNHPSQLLLHIYSDLTINGCLLHPSSSIVHSEKCCPGAPDTPDEGAYGDETTLGWELPACSSALFCNPKAIQIKPKIQIDHRVGIGLPDQQKNNPPPGTGRTCCCSVAVFAAWHWRQLLQKGCCHSSRQSTQFREYQGTEICKTVRRSGAHQL